MCRLVQVICNKIYPDAKTPDDIPFNDVLMVVDVDHMAKPEMFNRHVAPQSASVRFLLFADRSIAVHLCCSYGWHLLACSCNLQQMDVVTSACNVPAGWGRSPLTRVLAPCWCLSSFTMSPTQCALQPIVLPLSVLITES